MRIRDLSSNGGLRNLVKLPSSFGGGGQGANNILPFGRKGNELVQELERIYEKGFTEPFDQLIESIKWTVFKLPKGGKKFPIGLYEILTPFIGLHGRYGEDFVPMKAPQDSLEEQALTIALQSVAKLSGGAWGGRLATPEELQDGWRAFKSMSAEQRRQQGLEDYYFQALLDLEGKLEGSETMGKAFRFQMGRTGSRGMIRLFGQLMLPLLLSQGLTAGAFALGQAGAMTAGKFMALAGGIMQAVPMAFAVSQVTSELPVNLQSRWRHLIPIGKLLAIFGIVASWAGAVGNFLGFKSMLGQEEASGPVQALQYIGGLTALAYAGQSIAFAGHDWTIAKKVLGEMRQAYPNYAHLPDGQLLKALSGKPEVAKQRIQAKWRRFSVAANIPSIFMVVAELVFQHMQKRASEQGTRDFLADMIGEDKAQNAKDPQKKVQQVFKQMAMVMQLQAMALKKAVQEDKISQEKAQAQLSEVQDRFKQLVHEYQDTQEDAESLAWLAELARVLDMFGPFMQMYLNAPFGRMAVPASVRVAQGDPAMAGKGDFAAIFQQFKDSGIPLKTYITAVLGALGVNETLGILSVGTAPNAPWGENVPPKLREEVEGVESNVALQLGLQALQFGF